MAYYGTNTAADLALLQKYAPLLGFDASKLQYQGSSDSRTPSRWIDNSYIHDTGRGIVRGQDVTPQINGLLNTFRKVENAVGVKIGGGGSGATPYLAQLTAANASNPAYGTFGLVSPAGVNVTGQPAGTYFNTNARQATSNYGYGDAKGYFANRLAEFQKERPGYVQVPLLNGVIDRAHIQTDQGVIYDPKYGYITPSQNLKGSNPDFFSRYGPYIPLLLFGAGVAAAGTGAAAGAGSSATAGTTAGTSTAAGAGTAAGTAGATDLTAAGLQNLGLTASQAGAISGSAGTAAAGAGTAAAASPYLGASETANVTTYPYVEGAGTSGLGEGGLSSLGSGNAVSSDTALLGNTSGSAQSLDSLFANYPGGQSVATGSSGLDSLFAAGGNATTANTASGLGWLDTIKSLYSGAKSLYGEGKDLGLYGNAGGANGSAGGLLGTLLSAYLAKQQADALKPRDRWTDYSKSEAGGYTHLDPSIRALQDQSLGKTSELESGVMGYGTQFRNRSDQTMGQYDKLYGELSDNQNPFIQARVNPLKEQIASRRGELERSQGLRGVGGSSFANDELTNFDFGANRQLGDATSTATQEALGARSGALDKMGSLNLQTLAGNNQLTSSLNTLNQNRTSIGQQRLGQELAGLGLSADAEKALRDAKTQQNDIYGRFLSGLLGGTA